MAAVELFLMFGMPSSVASSGPCPLLLRIVGIVLGLRRSYPHYLLAKPMCPDMEGTYHLSTLECTHTSYWRHKHLRVLRQVGTERQFTPCKPLCLTTSLSTCGLGLLAPVTELFFVLLRSQWLRLCHGSQCRQDLARPQGTLVGRLRRLFG